ncbi:hypothetical protein FOZ63_014725 [Perkinsus olseni]|uniref:Uncharacterized protein n=1 Tax=Perkinsus olseni TaxID=32597 RepID=A0A7J6U7J4_PEROL|nr:hypothetical protein FOZ63_014725 [Perkinsus olseni]
MTAFAYVILFTSSLVSAVTAIHSSGTKTDRKKSKGLTADRGSKIYADDDRCSIEASGVRLSMTHFPDRGDYAVQYMIGCIPEERLSYSIRVASRERKSKGGLKIL